ncbi:uncharacterized protein APUU_30136S [Aspergillus puulaauensis]|uniref:Leucine-rich repeat domain-containing protein n=1 Tax=Aspergillus puulaauensis TaxID=1220207 RepID=A0A7R8AK65_9EURO|nr:uncharacterized protein APUU_30136S [Aspergillus puulaauensis]BCS21911.1 hypothetical protein APUU_30136S [Aspergillus puulaauensis]
MARNPPVEILFLLLDELEYTSDQLPLLQVCRNWNIALCAQVLQRNPRLRPLVQELHCPFLHSREDDESGFYNRALFHELLQSFTDTDNELVAWEKKLDEMDCFAWLAVLLVLLPNLRLLDLEWTWCGVATETTVWAVSRIASKSPQGSLPLQKLQKVSTRASDMNDRFSIKHFIPFLTLPSMQALHLDGCIDIDTPDDRGDVFEIPLELRPGISPIRELSLQESNFDNGLRELIPAFAQLERFEYQHTNIAEVNENHRNYRCHNFRDALLCQKRSLRELRLNDVGVTKSIGIEEFSDEYSDYIQESKAQDWFGSLVEFIVLKELRMPVYNLLGSVDGSEPSISLDKILPPSLETLVLTKVDFTDYSMIEGQLWRLLAARHQQFPSLRKILLQTFQLEVVDYDETRWEEYDREEYDLEIPERARTVFAGVASSCKEQGIVFDFSRYGDHEVVANGEVVREVNEIYSQTRQFHY